MTALSAVRAKVWLFHLQSSRSLSVNVIREVCSYLRDPHFFAAVHRESMELYDFNTHSITQHKLPACVDSGYLQVDGSTVLIVGEKVMKLDLLTLQTTPLASLLFPRDYVGVALVGNVVFAFGGYDDDSMTVCEKSSISPTHWTSVPPMHYARACFTPCAFKGLLYLAATAARDHRAVESFSPCTETCTVLPVSLPPEIELGCGSVAFAAKGELLLLTLSKQMARWEIESESCFYVSAVDRECYSQHPPLFVGSVVYVANIPSARVEKWSLEAARFV